MLTEGIRTIETSCAANPSYRSQSEQKSDTIRVKPYFSGTAYPEVNAVDPQSDEHSDLEDL